MTRFCKLPILYLSISAAIVLAQKDKPGFSPGPISSFEHKQAISGVTIGARAIESDQDAKPAFGKLNPYEHGILPVLVMIQNDTKEPIKLDQMSVQYMLPDQSKLDATPAQDVAYTRGPDRPNMSPSPLPIPRRTKKNPLSAFEIEGRAFAAKMLLPGESAHGFFYFQTRHRIGSHLYVTGLRQAATDKDLFFFEIPLTKAGN